MERTLEKILRFKSFQLKKPAIGWSTELQKIPDVSNVLFAKPTELEKHSMAFHICLWLSQSKFLHFKNLDISWTNELDAIFRSSDLIRNRIFCEKSTNNHRWENGLFVNFVLFPISLLSLSIRVIITFYITLQFTKKGFNTFEENPWCIPPIK